MNDKYLTVRPKEGLVVREPGGAIIPAEGATLPLSRYLSRRINAGDLIAVAPKSSDKSKAKAPKKVAGESK